VGSTDFMAQWGHSAGDSGCLPQMAQFTDVGRFVL